MKKALKTGTEILVFMLLMACQKEPLVVNTPGELNAKTIQQVLATNDNIAFAEIFFYNKSEDKWIKEKSYNLNIVDIEKSLRISHANVVFNDKDYYNLEYLSHFTLSSSYTINFYFANP